MIKCHIGSRERGRRVVQNTPYYVWPAYFLNDLIPILQKAKHFIENPKYVNHLHNFQFMFLVLVSIVLSIPGILHLYHRKVILVFFYFRIFVKKIRLYTEMIIKFYTKLSKIISLQKMVYNKIMVVDANHLTPST